MKPIILASQSPRRQELLQLLDLSFTIQTAQVNEDFDNTLKPSDIVMTLAQRKAEAVFNLHPEALVIGADTIVVHHDEILGKPIDKKDAYHMISRLAGDVHSVLTGVCLKTSEKEVTFFKEAKVYFSQLTDEEIEAYINTNEPYDKAGAYGIQGRAAKFIEGIEGDYYTIMGLPVNALYQHLKTFAIYG